MLTHRPEAFTFLSGKSPPQRTQSGRRFLLGLPAGLLLVLPIIWVLPRWPAPAYLPATWTSFYLGMPLIFLLVLTLSILIHELGHVVAGRWAGFQLMFLEIFFLRLARTPAGFRWQYQESKGSQLRGLTVMIPQNYDRLKPRLQWYIAGGPLATTGQFLFFAMISLLLRDHVLSYSAYITLLLMQIFGYAFLIISLYPFSDSSDGARLLSLARRGTNDDYQSAIMVFAQAMMAGRLNRDQDPEIIQRLLTAAGTTEEKLSARLLAYTVELDKGNIAEAATHLDDALAVMADQQQPLPAGPLVFWEAAYLETRYGHDPTTGQAWAELAEKMKAAPLTLDMRTSVFRAQAALAYAHGRPEEGRKYVADTLALLDESASRGPAESEKQWLLSLVAEVDPESFAADGRLRFASSTMRRTTLPLLKTAARFLLMVFVLLLVGGCIGLAVAAVF